MTDQLERLQRALENRYALVRELGRGGMAVVYLAQDRKLGREVALKVLRPELAASLGSDRFLREITIAARLKHPNILPLFDCGDADGHLYYTMPFIDGETLRDRLTRETQLPIDSAIQITKDVADALDYAHHEGIVHRDVKPENILFEAGHPVVSDFGIARAITQAGGQWHTEAGLGVGTPTYMSPEQASGESVDGRADVYALGCVLFEMLSGQPPHSGPSLTSLLARKTLGPVPSLRVVRETVRPGVEQAVEKALAVVPADRFATAAEFASELTRAHSADAEQPSSPAVLRRLPRRVAVGVGVLVTLTVLVPATWLIRGIGPDEPQRPVLSERIALQMPLSRPVADAPDLNFDLSPDGSAFVFVGQSRVGQQLYTQSVSGLTAEPIPGTAGARSPSISPDGQSVAFLSRGAIQRVSVTGGAPTVLAPAPGTVDGIDWGDGGLVVFTPGSASGLAMVSEEGGVAAGITRPDSQQGVHSHRWPQVLPGATQVLFTAWTGRPETSRIAVYSFDTGEVTYLVAGVTGRYVPTGHLVYATSDARLEVRDLQPETLLLGEVAHRVAEGVRTSPGAVFAVSAQGTLVYMTQETADRKLVLVDRAGRPMRELPLTGDISDPRFSPDGSTVAFTRREEGLASIWLHDVERQTTSRLTSVGESIYPLWAPDGQSLAYSSNQGGNIGLYLISLREGGAPSALLTGATDRMPESWSPDGMELIYRQTTPETGRDIWRLTLRDGTTGQELLVTAADERSAALSPDGQLLAYVSDESGRDEVYVSRYPSGGGRRQVSLDGGSEPAWAPSGDELFFRSGTAFFSVGTAAQDLAAARSRQLFEGSFMANPFRTNYDVHPDGEHFVLVAAAQTRVDLVVLLDWLPVGSEDRR